jgi:hypothetical protein
MKMLLKFGIRNISLRQMCSPLLIHTFRLGQQKILNQEKLSITDSVMNAPRFSTTNARS